MKEKDDILKKAIEEIKKEPVPKGPSKDLAEAALDKLNQVSSQLPEEHFDRQVEFSKRFMIINNLLRIAAVIIVSISIGYATGKLSTTKQPDMRQIRSELEPAIREQLLDDVTQYVQLGLESNYVQIRQELTEQFQQDLKQAAVEILNTSGTMTNQLLEELIQTIASAQLQDRQWVASAIEQIELNRLADKNQLGSALVNFASQTEQNLQETQENVAVIAKILTDTNADTLIPDENENSDN